MYVRFLNGCKPNEVGQGEALRNISSCIFKNEYLTVSTYIFIQKLFLPLIWMGIFLRDIRGGCLLSFFESYIPNNLVKST